MSVTLSNYRLDAFEVSVGRAREFIADFDAWRGSGEPLPGAGSHPRVADSGWQEEFTVQLPATGAELAERWTTCSFGGLVATDASGPRSTFAAASEGAASERVPLNCVTWYEAFAFCTWDGGRLPTLAELEYAGFGGDEQRTYPWGDAPPPNSERASFGCGDPPTERPECAAAPSAEVGTRPRGVGRFGQYDLAGSMSEWALDGVPTIAEPCTDCASLIDVSSRSRHGGSWVDGPEALENGEFVVQPPAVPVPLNGIRCARSE